MSKFEKFIKEYQILELVRDLKSGLINRNAEMQRSDVWKLKDQTEFIDSVFQSSTTYIPPIIGAETDEKIEIKGDQEKTIDLLDGKQRSTTIEKFVNNEIKLGNNVKPVSIAQENGTEKIYVIAGCKWDEIPEEVKTSFKANKIQMIFFKGMSFEERERQFIKLQGGMKLSNAEVNKVRIGHNIREFIYRQLSSELWSKYINVSVNREVKFETMQQVIMVITNQFDLSGKSLQVFSEKPNITDAIMEQVELITEYLIEVSKLIKKYSLPIAPVNLQKLEESDAMSKLDAKQTKKYLKPIDYFKKVNVPIIYRTAQKAILNNVSADDFAKFISKFFMDITAKYKSKTESGSSDPDKVCARVDILDEALVKAFNIVDKVVEENTDEEETDEEFDDVI